MLTSCDIQDFKVWGQQQKGRNRSVTICEYFVTYISHTYYFPTKKR